MLHEYLNEYLVTPHRRHTKESYWICTFLHYLSLPIRECVNCAFRCFQSWENRTPSSLLTHHVDSCYSGSQVFLMTWVKWCVAPRVTLAYASGLSWPTSLRRPPGKGRICSLVLVRCMLLVCLYGGGSPSLDLEYPVYGAHELADERAFASMVVLTACFPSGFCRDLNPRREGRRVPSGEGW